MQEFFLFISMWEGKTIILSRLFWIAFELSKLIEFILVCRFVWLDFVGLLLVVAIVNQWTFADVSLKN